MIIIGVAGKPGTEELKIKIMDWCSDLFEESVYRNITIPSNYKSLLVDEEYNYKIDKKMLNCNMVIYIEPKNELIACHFQTIDLHDISNLKIISIGIMRINEDYSEKKFKDKLQDIIDLYLLENENNIQVYTE